MDKTTQDLMFSSKKLDWGTPWDFFHKLNEEFEFDLDAAADSSNAKCEKFLTEQDDSLKMLSWPGSVIFLNPPYGRGLHKWYKKAYEESLKEKTVVMLVPARTDTKYFHQYVWDADANKPQEGVEVRFLKGRLKFDGAVDKKTGKPAPAPFPSMLVIFWGRIG